MEVRNNSNPKDAKHYDTARLREEFLADNLFKEGEISTIYSHIDRMIVGGVCPKTELSLSTGKELSSDYFLQRREMGIINIGGSGVVKVDDDEYNLELKDGLYIGMGAKEITFKSNDSNNPAKFYFNSAPAHKSYPTEKVDIQKAQPSRLGSKEDCNERTIYKYFHPEGIKSCQLVMGVTILEKGSVWNTMPCHTHNRRMEVYLYFDVKEEAMVFHFFGEPNETRHIVVKNEEAVISPSWSIHSGCGTSNYSFIWGMAGENQTFSDMDGVSIDSIR